MSDLSNLQTLVVTVSLSPESIDKLKSLFKHVHYHPDAKVPKDVITKAEVWFTNWQGIPEVVETIDDIPKLRLLQLSSGSSDARPRGAIEGKVADMKESWRQCCVEAEDSAGQEGYQADCSVQRFR